MFWLKLERFCKGLFFDIFQILEHPVLSFEKELLYTRFSGSKHSYSGSNIQYFGSILVATYTVKVFNFRKKITALDVF